MQMHIWEIHIDTTTLKKMFGGIMKLFKRHYFKINCYDTYVNDETSSSIKNIPFKQYMPERQQIH